MRAVAKGVVVIRNLSHVSIVVPNLDTAAKRLAETYGLSIGETKVNEGGMEILKKFYGVESRSRGEPTA